MGSGALGALVMGWVLEHPQKGMGVRLSVALSRGVNISYSGPSCPGHAGHTADRMF